MKRRKAERKKESRKGRWNERKKEEIRKKLRKEIERKKEGREELWKKERKKEIRNEGTEE